MAHHDPRQQKNLRLLSIPVSPWSERCKFALHVAGLLDQFEIVPYTPLVDEVYLRYITGIWNPKATVSVPVAIFDDRSILSDSVEIAKWAAKYSEGRLVVPDHDALQRVVSITEKVMQAGRFRSCSRAAISGAFDAEDLPPPLRLLPDFVNAASFRFVSRYLVRKYSQEGWTLESAFNEMRDGLKELDALRNANGGRFFVGNQFTLADIIASSALAFVCPLPDGYSRLGPNMGKEWVEPELETQFRNLREWRDQLYRDYRGSFRKVEGRSNL